MTLISSSPVDGRVLLGQGFLPFLQGLGLAVQVLFLLLQAILLPLQVGSAGLLFLLVLATVFQDLFLGLQQRLFLLGLGALDGLVDDALSLFFRAGDFLLRNFLPVVNTEGESNAQADHQRDGANDDLHGSLYLLYLGIDLPMACICRPLGRMCRKRSEGPLSPADNYPF